jgi:hypothetical protein
MMQTWADMLDEFKKNVETGRRLTGVLNESDTR